MRLLIWALAAAFAAGAPCAAYAQTTVEEERRETGPDLDAIVVSASRVPESLRDVSQSVQVITAADIERTGANDIVDLVKKLGIRTYMEGSDTYGNNGITMRGGRTSMHGFDLGGDILILVDGRRSATDFGSEFEMSAVERIEVLRGPGAVQFGSSALSGVINIITKRGEATPQAKVEAGMGSWSESKLAASGSGMAGKFDFSAAVSRRKRGNYEIPDGGAQENTDLPSRTNYLASVGYNIDDLNRIGLVFHGSNTDSAGKGASESSNSGANRYRFTRQDRNSYTFDLVYEGANQAETMGWMARYFRGETNYELSRYYFFHDPPAREKFSKSKNEFNGAQAQFSWRPGMFQLVTGVDWLKYDYDQVQLVANPTDAYSTINNIGAFLIGKLHLLQEGNLVLQAGLRYDDFDVNVKANSAVNGSWTRDVDTSVDKLNPSLGITYNPTEFLKLRANYGAAFKLPLPRQMGGFTYMMTTPFVGNPDLKPEESTNVEAGFDLEWRGLFFSATYFNTKMKNAITYRTITTASPDYVPGYSSGSYYWYYNAPKATVRGIEVGGSFDVGEYFDLDFRLEPYAYWTRLFRFHDEDTGEPLADRGKDNASFGVQFSYPAYKLSASIDGTWIGPMYSGSGSSARDISGGTVFDFSIRKALFSTENSGDVYIKANVRNLFNEEYQTTVDDIMPGRSFYVALEYNY
ncbi:MAG: TonB-dependent receptor [Deltaproteobacteria bacterium]|jgi:vitamin B12 transporter|nr:TonB-dependent receptor [Deltaproteobacteria bacterium]